MIESKIGQDLFDEIRTMFGVLIIGESETKIVSEKLNHQYLLNTNNIDEDIERYYYSICNGLLRNDEYKFFVSTGYIGSIETTLDPYPICYKGAYINRKQLIKRIEELIQKKLKLDGKDIECFYDLFSYLDKYAEGFKDGYDRFEDEYVNIYLNSFSKKSDYSKAVYNFLNERSFPNVQWLTNYSLFWHSNNNIIKAYESGFEQGNFYRAWSIILSQPHLFEKQFKRKQINNDKLLEDLIHSCKQMQEDNIFHHVDEDTRTRQILRLLPKKYLTKDQSQRGISGNGIKSGSIDAVIKVNDTEYLVEALNLSYINKNEIDSHINKLEYNYDQNGITTKFIIIYYNVDIGKFDEKVKRYQKYIEVDCAFIYKLTNRMEEIDSKYTDIRILKSVHNRESKEVNLYHILIKFPKK